MFRCSLKAFQVMIFVVAIAFLIYLQLHLIPKSQRAAKEREGGTAAPQARYSTTRAPRELLAGFFNREGKGAGSGVERSSARGSRRRGGVL